jgi:Holliday junction DNA helicase RuvB
LLKRVRDFCQVQRLARADIQIARAVLDMFAIDEQGLEEHDRKLLRAIIERFSGGPVGVNALASALGEDRDVIEEVYEPYLVKTGFVTRTPAGRMATELAYRHLNIPRDQ